MTLEVYKPGECVINFGEIGDKFYIILKGKISLLIPTKTKAQSKIKKNNEAHKERLLRSLSRHSTENFNDSKSNFSSLKKKKTMIDFDFLDSVGEIEEMQELKVLTSGDSFGELALLNNQPRSASAKCKEKSYLAVLSQKDYKKILSFNVRKAITEKFMFLKGLSFFSEVSDKSLKNLAFIITETIYKKNQTVYNDKLAAENLYLIKSGEFKITVKEQSDNKYFNNCSPSSPVKLKMLKNNNRVIEHQLVIKGKNELFGNKIIAEDGTPKIHASACISDFGIVYIINMNVIFI